MTVDELKLLIKTSSANLSKSSSLISGYVTTWPPSRTTTTEAGILCLRSNFLNYLTETN